MITKTGMLDFDDYTADPCVKLHAETEFLVLLYLDGNEGDVTEAARAAYQAAKEADLGDGMRARLTGEPVKFKPWNTWAFVVESPEAIESAGESLP